MSEFEDKARHEAGAELGKAEQDLNDKVSGGQQGSTGDQQAQQGSSGDGQDGAGTNPGGTGNDDPNQGNTPPQ